MDIDRDALLNAFAAEASEYLALMDEILLRIDRGEEQREDVQSMFRAAHTLKGAASCLALESLVCLTHSLEDVLEQAASGRLALGETIVILLFDCVDELRVLVEASRNDPNGTTPRYHNLLSRIDELLQRKGDAPQSASSSPSDAARHFSTGGHLRTLRVDVTRLDEMVNTIGEIGIARAHLAQTIGRLSKADRAEILEPMGVLERLHVELQERVMRARMVPLTTILNPLSRTVRDLAARVGKKATLAIDGGDVELDLSVIEHLKDPLMHILRNAVDHGIEPPDVRTACGKNASGLISVTARYQAGSVLIAISDDGGGIRRELLAATARQRGLDPEALAFDDLVHLIFEPGFSTRGEVTSISGRGIGMDVVRKNLEAIRGSVSVSTHEGIGTTIALRMPLTLAIVDGFCVSVAGESYLIPMEAVGECLACDVDEYIDGTAVMNIRGEPLPLIRLRELFGLTGAAPVRENVIVVQSDGGRAGLVVDSLHGEIQTVIRPVGKLFDHLTIVSSSAILGDGRVALTLDVAALIRQVSGARTVADAAISRR